MTDSLRYAREQNILAGVKRWAAFYRANPQRFAADYLCLHLYTFQKILLYMMNIAYYFCFISARGIGKTYLSAIFCCIRCILYPGTKICIASGTRGQSINVLEKIQNELMKNSPYLQNEIQKVQIGNMNVFIRFKNGSIIKVVTASDSARGNRANILLVDEFRMVDQDTIGTVLRKFLTSPRMPGYLHDKRYKHLKERNKEMYLSSAYFTSHWSYDKVKDFGKAMLDPDKRYFVCGFPYQLSIEEGLLDAEAVADEMAESNFSEIKWLMEMGAEFYGDVDGSFFDFETIAKTRKIQYPMLPDELLAYLPDKRLRIQPKQPGEKRILSLDVALMSSRKNKNDASATFINQLTPIRNRRYISNIIYTETSEGQHTEDQALRARKLFDMYDCDYLVIDVRGVGSGVCDALLRELSDADSGYIYPPLSVCNDQEWAMRCRDPEAQKAIWVINNQTAKFNSDCALWLREGFASGRVRLLMSEFDAEEGLLPGIKGFNGLDATTKLKVEMPYIDTTLLVNELVNLQYEAGTGSAAVKIYEKSGYRKDRYSSLAYNYWVACQLEAKLAKTETAPGNGGEFLFRAPKVK